MNDKTEQMLIKLQGKIDWIAIAVLVGLIGAAGYLVNADRSTRIAADTGSAPPAKLEDSVATSPDYAAFQKLSKAQVLTDFPQYQSMIRNSIFDAKAVAGRQALKRAEDQKFDAIKAQAQPIADKIEKKESVDATAKEAAIKALTEFRKSAPAHVGAFNLLNIIDPPPIVEEAAPPAMDASGGMPGGMPSGMPGGMPGGSPAAMPGGMPGGAPVL